MPAQRSAPSTRSCAADACGFAVLHLRVSASFFSDFVGPFPDVLWEPEFLTVREQSELLEFCRHRVPWQREQMTFGSKTVDVPRELAWFGDVPYSYSGLKHKPAAMPAPLGLLALKIETWLAHAGLHQKFNSVLLNHYRGGSDSIGMHADDEPELGAQPVIASISLGAPRTFVFRHTSTSLQHKNLLTSGSLLVMKGDCQEHWRHGVPKEPVDGPRVNLTFRTTFLRQPALP